MIKCIIVEDEPLAQQVIQNHLQRITKFELVATCNDATEALATLKTQEVDLIFLDIRLPGLSGLNFLKQLKTPPLIVLTTAYPNYALESYEFNVIDYLLKPISFDRFLKAVNKIIDNRLFSSIQADMNDAFSDHIFIKSGSKFFKVKFSEIIYIQGMRDYLKIHTTDYTLVTHQTMNDIEKTMPGKMFLRVHKSYIVAILHIKVIYGNSIEIDNTTIPIGESYKNAVMNLIGRKN
ncbi:MAG TPA: response regulator transcription factor [Puia sp.]|nr:response regulator transcription factor [Puia sp.]